jgi:cation transport ATPase
MDTFEEQLTTLEAQGKTAMLIALDGKLAGVVAVAETPSKLDHRRPLSSSILQ